MRYYATIELEIVTETADEDAAIELAEVAAVQASEIRASLVAQREADRAAQREETGHPMMCGCSECM